MIWQTERVGAADMTPNQSLAGVLARLYDSIETPGLLWLSFALLMLAVGLSRAGNAHADGDELTAFTLVGLTTNVISPISWSHHLVWVLPAIIVLADTALRRRDASRGLLHRIGPPPAGPSLIGVAGLRSPIWFPTLTGLRHAVAAVGLYLLFLISPIWPYEHQLPEVSHYAGRALRRADGELAGARADRAGGGAALAPRRRARVLRRTAPAATAPR